ncbi:hypothetical protein WEH80_23550 [Actinomycetes bacterium KLBMP 9759]
MRGRSLVVAGLSVLALSACTAPPAVVPGKPAPTLPAESVAYDDITFLTTREPVFKDTCLELPRESMRAAGLTTPPHQTKGFGNGAGGCAWDEPWGRAWIENIQPPVLDVDADDPPPAAPFKNHWDGASRFVSVYGTPSYFRRFILDERYYAVQVLAFSAAGPDCNTIVDTGSPIVFMVTAGPPDDGTEYESEDLGQSGKVAAEFCPKSLEMAKAFISALDPDGGSLVGA